MPVHSRLKKLERISHHHQKAIILIEANSHEEGEKLLKHRIEEVTKAGQDYYTPMVLILSQ